MRIVKISNEWRTPDWLFKQLDDEFHFDMDLCARYENAKCNSYCTDFLETPHQFFYGKRCFMNPPYSQPFPFISRAACLPHNAKCPVVVMLVKADPSTAWWGIFWDYELHKPREKCEVRFLPKRVKFLDPNGNVKGSPTFASAIVIVRK
jgi:site-specific DNA-methyltransferase (adenine-specific)